MSDNHGLEIGMPQATTADESLAPVVSWGSELDTLLDELRDATQGSTASVVGRGVDEQLVQVRLGVAASLFATLRCKHPPTAAHVLRVALMSSAWCMKLGLSEPQRDMIEVAALLHDLGISGVPDRILQKPGILTADEASTVARARRMSAAILSSACVEPALLEIVENIPARFDGSRPGYPFSGRDIPLGARMIAIVESFDAMTTDRVYRKAMSREAAMNELFACAGSQFDPDLVTVFAEFEKEDQAALCEETANRWLFTLDPSAVDGYWRFNPAARGGDDQTLDDLFHSRLINNMHDAVVFVDANLTVKLWNHGTERMTGISGQSVYQRQWMPELLNLRDEKGDPIKKNDCPVAATLQSGVQSLRRLSIWGRTGRPISVDSHVIPVLAEDGSTLGAILLLHDASSQISLEERCQSLHEKATRDPLTKVANRAEYDRVHAMFVVAHQRQRLPCSLIICDLDHFKKVNDTYGHQAGDSVIKSFAGVLKDSCRSGDLVARYGGEEFVVLCADCDNATAATRAEEIRRRFADIPQPRLGGRLVTASFGVTEIQPGDTPETMLRRADRALLMAKAKGRNSVVQLGTGSAANEFPLDDHAWATLSGTAKHNRLFEQQLMTCVPMSVAIEKLRGFVADHQANILAINENSLRLLVEHRATGQRRQSADRSTAFIVDLRLEEDYKVYTKPGSASDSGSSNPVRIPRTRILLAISPKTDRERRLDDTIARAKAILLSFRSYLMATEEVIATPSMSSEPLSETALEPPTSLDRWIAEERQASQRVLQGLLRILTPWRRRTDPVEDQPSV